MAGDSATLLRGTLDLMVMQALTWGPMHGYGIALRLEEASGGVLEVEDSAMYQALHRLEDRELVRSEWGVTEKKRQARYYSITKQGRDWLHRQSDDWFRFSTAVTRVLRTASHGA